MYTNREARHFRPDGQRGYSLIELVASLLLIAAIAVLSLPTYQDFSPHPDSAGPQAHPAAAETDPEQSGELADRPASSQPVSPGQGESTEDKARESAEERKEV